MKHLWTIAWALALALLLAQAGAAQDSAGVVGYEVFSTSTPGGGGTMESQGLTGERTSWFTTHAAPSNAGVVNMVVTYYDNKESRDKAIEKEKAKNKKKKDEKKSAKQAEPPPVPTFDPRFYEYKDGKVVPKTQPESDGIKMSLSNSGTLTANGGNGDANTDKSYKLANLSTGNSIEGMVLPDNVQDRQPFSFALPQHTGEVVNVQTVEGEVVQSVSADRYGRIFVATGLPAGAYLISMGSGAQPIGKIEVSQRTGDALPFSQSMRLVNAPEALKLSDPFSLKGDGFSPNFKDMQVSLSSSGQSEAPIVLAATEDQLKLTPLQQLQPGAAELRVSNLATGQMVDFRNLLLYHLQANLVRRTLKSGKDKTQLVIKAQPENQPLKVKVNVVSGPVDFGDGRKEAEGTTSNGQAVFPVHAERGAGAFQLAWELTPDQPGAPRLKKDQAASCKNMLHISCIQGYGPSGFCCDDDPPAGGLLACSEMCKNKQ